MLQGVNMGVVLQKLDKQRASKELEQLLSPDNVTNMLNHFRMVPLLAVQVFVLDSDVLKGCLPYTIPVQCSAAVVNVVVPDISFTTCFFLRTGFHHKLFSSQDWLTQVSWQSPHLVHILDCKWNRQVMV